MSRQQLIKDLVLTYHNNVGVPGACIGTLSSTFIWESRATVFEKFGVGIVVGYTWPFTFPIIGLRYLYNSIKSEFI